MLIEMIGSVPAYGEYIVIEDNWGGDVHLSSQMLLLSFYLSIGETFRGSKANRGSMGSLSYMVR